MAALTNTDIKSTTIEGGFLELAQLLQSAEQEFIPPAGVAKANKVRLTIDTDANTATISATVPLALVVGADGGLRVTAATYC